MGVYVSATVGDNKTLEQFSKLIETRIKYLGEMSRDSVAACAIDALKSIRALTTKATRRSVTEDVKVKQDSSLYPSFKSVGKTKRFCLRFTGSNKQYNGYEKVVTTGSRTKVENLNVYRFEEQNGRKKSTYLIVAPSQKEAEKKACQIRRSRALQYAGLARTALSLLMKKTATVSVPMDSSQNVNEKADQMTTRIESKKGNQYSLQLNDNLDYALNAVKGGDSGVDLALRKAMNKITATVNRKCSNILLFTPLPTPFPEVKQRG